MNALNPDPDLKKTLTFINTMADMDDLEVILQAFNKRRHTLNTQKARKLAAELSVGDEVVVTGNIKPRYFIGRSGEVKEFKNAKALVDFGGKVGRFSRLTWVPLTALAKL